MEKMEKTNKKGRKISEIIIELEKWEAEIGDVEVVIANSAEQCFDGFGKTFAIKIVEGGETLLGVLRNEVVIKP